MHRPATNPDGKYTEWPNGKGNPPRLCRETGFPCSSAGWVRVTRLAVVHRCADCGRRWFERMEDES